MRKIIFFLLAVLVATVHLQAQAIPDYKRSDLPIERRVQDLLQRMTPEEKFWQLFMIPGDLGDNPSQYKNGIFGFQVNTVQQQHGAAAQILNYKPGQTGKQTLTKINEIQKYFVEQTRLGIPIIAFDEALHGLVRYEATAFPQAIALAATWNTSLMNKVAAAIAMETKARGIRQILSPVVNLATDVRWGRVEETYGEDPFLTSTMGIAFVKAFEQRGVVTTPKHFAVNHGEGGRDSYPIHYNNRLLEETYFVPFKEVVQKGGARSMMTAYNSLDGSPCTANNWLLNEKLKKEWGFNGFVISDAGATGGANVLHFTAKDYAEAGKTSVENGLDVIFQTAFEHHTLFDPHFLGKTMNQAAIDSAVARVLRIKFELGLFEHPYAKVEDAGQWTAALHHDLAREAARNSFVLLKNTSAPGKQTNVLPLNKSTERIAVIGVDAVEKRLGGYSGPGNIKVSILDGIKAKTGKTTNVLYAPGPGREHKTWAFVPGSNLSTVKDGKKVKGLKAEYFNNVTMQGQPVVERIDEEIKFQWTLFSPDQAKINYDFFSGRWTGKLKSPVTGNYKIGIDGNDGYRLYINNKMIIDNWKKQSYSTALVDHYFEKGKEYDIRIEYYEPAGNAWMRLIWNVGVQDNSEQKIQEAVQVAKNSDVAVVVVGIEEGEFNDRALLSLPGKQEELIKRVAATGKPVVVLLVGGSAITMTNWLDKVNSVLDIWYPGDAGGNAVADVLFGDYSPAGRLPITFPVAEAQLPLVYNHKPTGRGDDYNNLTGQPLFPFGFGLSYTSFDYTSLKMDKEVIRAGESMRVSFKVKNTGKVKGDEVVQLYIRDELSSVARPLKELKGFQRITLAAGEEKEVAFTITPDMLKMFDVNMKEVIEPGAFRIMIGSSSMDIRLRTLLEVK
ncbi:glycoside hydrolase family 3 protein [Lacibacter sediminis]|uniref:Glycoside hydrolase family 3 C-terminal domain-containing protein n=1 Tax=Lacibacter sediminis TaxID=2760713 RepID=A0A7G5XC68_9BACT|nr:glycoside hydrolase family 3 protein [Lacibacter sediminis]QNA43071.1 glycoside hydrolase family 3 C-terminal domain-containing protein [Lacibacter sediminis]